MRLFFITFLLLPVLGFGQLKPIAQAVEQARVKYSNKANTAIDLFTFNGTDKALPTALSSDKPIYKLTLNPNALSRIQQERREYLEMAVPTANGLVELELVPATIFAPGFTVKTSAPDPNFTFDPSKLVFYQGIVKGNPNSLVAVTISDSEIIGMVSDSTGNRVLAHKQDKTALVTEYVFYDERAVMSEARPFYCGTTDLQQKASSTTDIVNNADSLANKNSTCVRYVGIYAEVDYTLYQHYGNTSTTTVQIAFLFNQVATIYRNESLYVKLSQLYIWTSADPHDADIDKFTDYWNARGNNFPGQLAHLLAGGTTGFTAGGIAWVVTNSSSLAHRPAAYGVTELNASRTFNTYPTYSRGVKVVTHEIGHNLGSNHTHWCGWSGGAIDNCAPSEDHNGVGCALGPETTNGGTIMSYCDSRGVAPVNFLNGFGSQPGTLIRNRVAVASANLPVTTNDNGLQSITSGNWTSGSTWVCGLTPSVINDVTINSGNAVQLNTSATSKSLNINGSLNLSTTSSILNINN